MTNIEKGSLIILCAVIVVIIILLICALYFTKKRENTGKKNNENVQKFKHGMPYDDIKKFFPFDAYSVSNLAKTYATPIFDVFKQVADNLHIVLFSNFIILFIVSSITIIILSKKFSQ